MCDHATSATGKFEFDFGRGAVKGREGKSLAWKAPRRREDRFIRDDQKTLGTFTVCPSRDDKLSVMKKKKKKKPEKNM